MWKRTPGLIVLAATLFAGGGAQAQHKMSWHDYRQAMFALSKVERADVVMLGDSLTEGAEWLELTGCTHLVNRGIGGDTTAKLLARLDETLALKPRAVFLMVGVNDISLTVPKATTEANYRTILDRLAGRRVVAAYVLPVAASYPKRQINGAIAALNDSIAALTNGRADVTLLDLRPLLRGSDGYLREEFSYDGLHLTPKAYGVWRDAIAPELAKYCGDR